jgi:hypothetical protein
LRSLLDVFEDTLHSSTDSGFSGLPNLIKLELALQVRLDEMVYRFGALLLCEERIRTTRTKNNNNNN